MSNRDANYSPMFSRQQGIDIMTGYTSTTICPCHCMHQAAPKPHRHALLQQKSSSYDRPAPSSLYISLYLARHHIIIIIHKELSPPHININDLLILMSFRVHQSTIPHRCAHCNYPFCSGSDDMKFSYFVLKIHTTKGKFLNGISLFVVVVCARVYLSTWEVYQLRQTTESVYFMHAVCGVCVCDRTTGDRGFARWHSIDQQFKVASTPIYLLLSDVAESIVSVGPIKGRYRRWRLFDYLTFSQTTDMSSRPHSLAQRVRYDNNNHDANGETLTHVMFKICNSYELSTFYICL